MSELTLEQKQRLLMEIRIAVKEWGADLRHTPIRAIVNIASRAAERVLADELVFAAESLRGLARERNEWAGKMADLEGRLADQMARADRLQIQVSACDSLATTMDGWHEGFIDGAPVASWETASVLIRESLLGIEVGE